MKQTVLITLEIECSDCIVPESILEYCKDQLKATGLTLDIVSGSYAVTRQQVLADRDKARSLAEEFMEIWTGQENYRLP